MKKNSEQLKGRKALCIMALEKPAEFGEYLQRCVNTWNQLHDQEKKPTTQQIIGFLSDLLFLSPKTVENHFYGS